MREQGETRRDEVRLLCAVAGPRHVFPAIGHGSKFLRVDHLPTAAVIFFAQPLLRRGVFLEGVGSMEGFEASGVREGSRQWQGCSLLLSASD